MMTQRERPVTASPSWLAPEPCTSASTLAVSPTQIADYEATAGKVRTVAVGLSHNQPGDPAKLADVLITFVDAPNPPVRLPLGSGTVAAIEAKHASDAAILCEWRSMSVSTHFLVK